MHKSLLMFLIAVFSGLSLASTHSWAQTPEDVIVDSATNVLDEIMRIRASRIPHALLTKAEGIAIVPHVVKAGFVVGVRRGRGVVLVRDETGAWKPPVFVTLKGGSVGWQAGIQSTDVILVFKNRDSIFGLANRKLTIGVDAAAAAGPVGREATAATDARLKAEILSYSRSRGLFAGVSLDGSALRIDAYANHAYYHGPRMTLDGTPVAADIQLPPSALRLLERLSLYSGSPLAGAPFPEQETVFPADEPETRVSAEVEEERLRQQLAESSRQLQTIIDKRWQSYLALPAEVFDPGARPNVEALNQSLTRFDTVASDPRYRQLVQRPEFVRAHTLLKEYSQRRSLPPSTPMELLPPPIQP